MSFNVTTLVLAAAVADTGTVTVSYPAGTAQANFIGPNAAANTGVLFLNDNDRYNEAASGVRINLTYGASNITLTNNTGQSWPAGSTVRLQLGRAGNDRPEFVRSPAIASLTDSSGGTASATLAAISGTYVQAEVRNSIASLNAKIEEILIMLRAEGIIS
jgi:hypothetical protein